LVVRLSQYDQLVLSLLPRFQLVKLPSV